MTNPFLLFECQYNKAVICDCMRCDRCGWNPKVDDVRKAKTRILLGMEPPVVKEKWRIGNGSFTK